MSYIFTIIILSLIDFEQTPSHLHSPNEPHSILFASRLFSVQNENSHSSVCVCVCMFCVDMAWYLEVISEIEIGRAVKVFAWPD